MSLVRHSDTGRPWWRCLVLGHRFRDGSREYKMVGGGTCTAYAFLCRTCGADYHDLRKAGRL